MKRFFLIMTVVLLTACWPEEGEKTGKQIVFEKETIRIFSPEEQLRAELTVEIADTEPKRVQGLMYRTELADNAGMLFLLPSKQRISMWMANTPLSLDMVFIDEQGKIVEVVENTVPFSHDIIRSKNKARGVLEIKAGFSKHFDFQSGDIVEHPFFKLEKAE